jgi:hypothetical protein
MSRAVCAGAIVRADIALILRAAAFAAERHRNQRRKGSDAAPYINHPLALANLLPSAESTMPVEMADSREESVAGGYPGCGASTEMHLSRGRCSGGHCAGPDCPRCAPTTSGTWRVP